MFKSNSKAKSADTPAAKDSSPSAAAIEARLAATRARGDGLVPKLHDALGGDTGAKALAKPLDEVGGLRASITED